MEDIRKTTVLTLQNGVSSASPNEELCDCCPLASSKCISLFSFPEIRPWLSIYLDWNPPTPKKLVLRVTNRRTKFWTAAGAGLWHGLSSADLITLNSSMVSKADPFCLCQRENNRGETPPHTHFPVVRASFAGVEVSKFILSILPGGCSYAALFTVAES